MSQANDAHPLDSPSFMTDPKPELLLSLPDPPILAILSHLPLQQLIANIPLVHPRLAPFRQSVLKSTQRLVLHIGDQWEIHKLLFDSSLRLPFASHLVDSTGALLYPETDNPTLHLATLDDHSVKQLSSLMPAIVHLQVAIAHARVSVYSQLSILLSNWASTLQTLTITIGDIEVVCINEATWGEEDSKQEEDSWEESTKAESIVRQLCLLIQCINSKLGALQTLSLDIGSVLYPNTDEFLFGEQTPGAPLNLSILGQLKEFYLNLGNCLRVPSFLLEQLDKFATEKLTTIGLAGEFNWNLNAVENSQFVRRITIASFCISPSAVTPLLPSFTSLTVYGFNWQHLSALELVDHLRVLATLSNLQCLKVDYFDPVWHPVLFPDLLSLPSVTVLEIEICLEDNENHDHLQASFWETLFPSLQILKVNHFGDFCTLCYPGEDWTARTEIPDYAQVTPCLRQLFAPLRDLPSLRKIFHQRKEQSDYIAEFTPQGEFIRTHEFIC